MLTETTRNYDIFDLAKFVLGLFVVAIHCNLEPELLFPWLRIAVPLFFVMSAYLFFKKTYGMPVEESIKALVMFGKRSLILYAVWTVLLFPATLRAREYTLTLQTFTWKILPEFFMGDGFLASWYIMAGLVAVVIVYVLSMKLNTYIVLGIALLTNIFCCLVSGYKDLLPTVNTVYEWLVPMIGNVRLNFVVALFWVALGKAFAEGKLKIPLIPSLLGAALSGYLLSYEADYTLLKYNAEFSRDCYFMLIPFCMFLFAILLSLGRIKVPLAPFLRMSSTVMYVTHYTFLRLLAKRDIYRGEEYEAFAFSVVVPVTVLLSALIYLLSRKLKFLKYLY